MQTFPCDTLHVGGRVRCRSITMPAGAIDDRHIAASSHIAPHKYIRRHYTQWAQPNTVNAAGITTCLYVASRESLYYRFGATQLTMPTAPLKWVKYEIYISRRNGAWVGVNTGGDAITFTQGNTPKVIVWRDAPFAEPVTMYPGESLWLVRTAADPYTCGNGSAVMVAIDEDPYWGGVHRFLGNPVWRV